MRNLMNKGKGAHYSPKRRHATPQEIQEFGFVPKSTSTTSSPESILSLTGASPADNSKNRNNNKKPGTTLPAFSGRGVAGAGAETGGGGEEKPQRRKWWFW